MKRLAPMLNGHRRLHRGWPLSLAAILCILAPASLLVGCGDDETNVTFPPEPPQKVQPWLFDIYGTSATDVWAVGNGGNAFHFDGTDWTPASLPGAGALPITAIWGPGDGTLYACGHGGKIWFNSGGGWSSMTSGTTENLYAIGVYDDVIHAVGYGGTMRRLTGGSWSGVAQVVILRDPTQNNAPLDTLNLSEDTASLQAVNEYFIGGAYYLPNYEPDDDTDPFGNPVGMAGTDGMVLAPDDPPPGGTRFDWLLRPLRGAEPALVDSEWIFCATSDGSKLTNNYLGTSEGWLFRLRENAAGEKVWEKNLYQVTANFQSGIRDMWIDGTDNLYMVTEDGTVVHQMPDGTREILYRNALEPLMTIWATGPENIFFGGFTDGQIMHAVHDTVGVGSFTLTRISLDFKEKAGPAAKLLMDPTGRLIH